MSTTVRDGRRLTGYVTDSHDQQNVAPAQIHHHSLYDDGMDDYHHIDDDYDDDEPDDESVGSVLSIPDPDIDFDLVYALHTFAATVEGQASVVKGDALTLLDDSNSYWWLVKVLKTSEVGYIPAENIETPHERLARLNSHRNIELTQRDIQDAFPAPPSTKPKSNKKVKLAKGVQFQAQVIFGSSDDEEFEEEFEEWQETIRSDSDTDDLDDTTDSDDDDDYYDDVQLYGSTGTYDYGQSSVDNYARTHPHQQPHPHQHQQQQQHHHHQQQHQQQQQQHARPHNASGSAGAPIRPGTNASIPPSSSSSLQQQQQQQQQPRSTTMPFKDNLDLEATETIKYSLTPEVARDTHESGHQYREMSYGDPQSKADKLESILSGDDKGPSTPAPPVNEQRRGSKDKKEKGGLRKLFSRNKDGKDKKQRKGSMEKQTPVITVGGEVISSETASLSSQSTGYSDRDRAGSIDSSHMQPHPHQPHPHHHPHHHHHQQHHQQQQQQYIHPHAQPQHVQPQHAQQQHQQQHQQRALHSEPIQPHVLKIYAGNVRFGGEFKTIDAYPDTTAAELIQHALQKFDIQNHQPDSNADAHLDYFLVVRGVDGDEYTLVPNDRPLAIYSSLTAHLNTPMPSLKKARRISQLMGTSDSTHIGGPKERSEDVEEMRFYLYTKAKRPEDGHMSIKVSLFASDIGGNTSILKLDQTRVDKLVTVPIHASVGDVTALLLDKFHILNGIVDGPDAEEKAQSLRLRGTEDQAVRYQLSVSKQGKEMVLAPTAAISGVFGDNLPPVTHRRNSSNPDRASIASLSSVITAAPQPDETFFILRRSDRDHLPHVETPRPVRPPRPVRQDTPMPKGTETPPLAAGDQPALPVPTNNNGIHPLAVSTTLSSSPPSQQQLQSDPVLYDEPESAVDVLMKLDQALDNLAHTRNSNEPLTEAIVASSLNNSRDMLQQTLSYEDEQQQQQQHTEPQQQQQQQQHMETRQQEHIVDNTARHLDHEPPVQQPTEEEAIPSSNAEPDEPTGRNGRTPVDSMLFCEEFGMNELMVLIRGAVRYAEEQEHAANKTHKHPPIRTEISEVFKDSQQRLEQLEKELDRLMADAVRVYS